MEYSGYLILQDETGYAPKHLRFSFFKDGCDYAIGFGESIEDCKMQIDDLQNEKSRYN